MMKKSILRATAAWQAVALLGAGASAAFLAAVPAAAQNITAGELSGTIVDEANNPVADATVSIRSAAGVSRTVSASAGGTFSISQIPVGPYTVLISKEGRPTVRNEGVMVELGGSNYIFQMVAAAPAAEGVAPAAGEEIVVVGTRRRAVDFSGTATGAVFNVQEVAEQIPVPRTIEAITLLAPQATAGDSTFSTEPGVSNGTVSLAGSSVAENIFYINGMNITNFRTFVGGSTVPFEFYDQVQIKTGGYQAEFGRNTGGAVIALTRSGSNEFKGGLNFSYIPNALRSKSPSTYAANNRTDRTINAEGNVWASGPIIKDRLFFFGFFNPRYSFEADTARQPDEDDDGNQTGTFTDTNRTSYRSKTPFYGGKLDLALSEGHRIEGTYFNDSNKEFVVVRNLATGTENTLTNQTGGRNMIAKYTGSFADWLTLSALYGKSEYDRTSPGSQDDVPYTVDRRSGVATLIGGSSNALVGIDFDQRKNYRVDADITANFFGQHKIRAGWDLEKLTADSIQQYSGGIAYIFERSGATGARGGLIPPNTDYARVQTYSVGGSFDSKNTAFYIQDSWDVNDRLNLSLGIRNDTFINRDKVGDVFTEIRNQWAPRVGFNYDVFGDERTRLSGFYGRYYLPVAANTNTRLAGGELFLRDFYLLPTGPDGVYSGSLTAPTLGNKVDGVVFSDGTLSPASTLVAKNIKPQFMNEFIIGGEHRFENRHRFSVNLIRRNLGAVLEDVDFDGDGGAYASIADEFCATQTLSYCNPDFTPLFGSGGYLLMNPGEDAVFDAVDQDGNLQELTIPADFIGIGKAKRKYLAAEFLYNIPFNGVWGLTASYVLSSSKGNYEGGVKSDTGQDDTGITTDFDEPGYLDGAYGYLPNHRAHTLKVFGNWSPIEPVSLGFNALLQSPRKYGCLGTYPLTDGRANDNTAVSRYCNAQIEAGNIDGTLNEPLRRGAVFDGDWRKRIDLSFAYKLPLAMDIRARIDVFNAFNFKSKLDFNERGDIDDVDTIDPNFRKVQVYETPRYVRFGISANF